MSSSTMSADGGLVGALVERLTTRVSVCEPQSREPVTMAMKCAAADCVLSLFYSSLTAPAQPFRTSFRTRLSS